MPQCCGSHGLLEQSRASARSIPISDSVVALTLKLFSCYHGRSNWSGTALEYSPGSRICQCSSLGVFDWEAVRKLPVLRYVPVMNEKVKGA